VAGGGSSARSIRESEPTRRAGFEAAGFARIDLVGRGADERLFASLYRVRAWPGGLEPSSRLAARWSVDRDGRSRAQ
jgi:hypothetical protein